MRRLFIDGELQDEIVITGSDAHHLMHVMRARAGQHCVVVDSRQQVAEAEIKAFTADSVLLQRLSMLESCTESPIEITLAQCLPKGDKMDFIVQKAVELGASFVQPLRSTNCVVRYDAKKAAARQQKWQKVADEASKQCGRSLRPVVQSIVSLEEWLAALQPEDGCVLFCYENEQQQGIRSCLQASQAGRYIVLIGPEGGFTPAEAARIQAAGACTVTMGPRILRAETAALTALAVLQYEKGDLGGRRQ